MSISSSLFRQKNTDLSADIEDLKQQNRLLYQQNLTLKQSLQDLITINTELTESIEQFNNSHIQNFPHVNQQEIEQLALKVIELQQQLQKQKMERTREKEELKAANQQNNTIQQTLKVIEELVNSVKDMQEQYQNELEKIEVELENHRNQWLHMSETVEHKMVSFEKNYSKLIEDLHQSQTIIRSLEAEKNKSNTIGKKSMPTSTEDLRVTLQKQIKEKDRVIEIYEHTLQQVKFRLTEKISS